MHSVHVSDLHTIDRNSGRMNRFTLQDAVAECSATLLGEVIWRQYGRWPVYSKFFDNMGPIPHHMHQSAEDAALVGQEGKPEVSIWS